MLIEMKHGNCSHRCLLACRLCGTVGTEPMPATGHMPSEVISDVVEPTWLLDGHHLSVVSCAVCGAELSRETVTDTQDSTEYRLYHLLSEGLRNQETKINISSLRLPYQATYGEMIMETASSVLAEQASLFYTISCRLLTDSVLFTSIEPAYLYDEEGLETARQEFETMITELLSAVPEGLSPEETALFFHDLLIERYTYDRQDDDHASFDAYSMMKSGTGVCQAYAALYAELMNRSGIPTGFARIDPSDEYPEGHQWNVVVLNNKTYHVDVTKDDRDEMDPCLADHTFFLLTDDELKSDRDTWISSESCTDTTYVDWPGRTSTENYVLSLLQREQP